MSKIKIAVNFVCIGLVGVFLNSYQVQASDSLSRDKIIEKKLSCFSKNSSRKDIDWDDVCLTQDKKGQGRYGDDLEKDSSLDNMIQRHQQMVNEILDEPVIPEDDMTERTMDEVIEKNKQDPDDNKTVDDVIKEQNVTHSSVSSKESYQLAQAKNYGENHRSSDLTNDARRSEPMTSANSFDRGFQDLNTFEFGFEYNHFRYEEDIFDLVDQGHLFGAYTSYTFRPARGNSTLEDIIDVYKLEGRFNYGKVDYKSNGSGTLDRIKDWTYEVRLLAGKDFLMGSNMRMTPLVGFGYRYLNDDSGGKQTSTGAFGYEREANYFYIPLGLEFAARVADSWVISPSIEYDILIQGRQKSHLSDVPGGFPDITNKQHDGFGVRGSIKFIKEFPSVDFVVEPYYRYWDIDDSDVSTGVGSIFIVSGQEPANTSQEYGVRLGAIF